jgi:hypothetical protein
MAYVDLNPVRAGIANSPETSDYTSIQERIQPRFQLNQAIDDQQACGDLLDFQTPLKPLLAFEGGVTNEPQPGILFAHLDYLELLDWTGRIIRKDTPGCIENDLPPILTRLHTSPQQWKLNVSLFESLHAQRFNRLKRSIDTG